jgi:hypothetical protein
VFWGRRLVQVEWEGHVRSWLKVWTGRPRSKIINNTGYVVTLGGEIWTIDNLAGPPFGAR